MPFLKIISDSLGSIEVETEEKITSSLRPAAYSKSKFIESCNVVFAPFEVSAVNRALDYAESLRSTDPHHPSMKIYFAHPVRVATFVLKLSECASLETATMALLHNVFEVSGLKEQDLIDAGFGPRIADGIRLLTIDRERQYDTEYLTEFYRNIEAFGSDLSLVKCADRLDNLLGFDLIARNERIEKYLSLSSRFVVPLAHRLAPDFGDYLAKVIQYFQARDCKEELKRKYESFLKKAIDDEKAKTTQAVD